ncbi:hypothetical protein Tco_1410219 [Tanacetum coccineum]
MRLSIRSWVTEWKGLPLLLLKFLIRSRADSGSGLRCQFQLNGAKLKLILLGLNCVARFGYAVKAYVDSAFNPIIYTSCIEQFWATAKVQTVNGVVCYIALVDKKGLLLRSQALGKIFTWMMQKRAGKRIFFGENNTLFDTIDGFKPSKEVGKAKAAKAKEIALLKEEVPEGWKGGVWVLLNDASTGVGQYCDIDIDCGIAKVVEKDVSIIKAAKPKVVTTAATTTTTTRPKARGVVVQEPSEFRAPQETQPSSSKDKGKGIMIEPEVPLKRKDQIALDEQIARDIQAKLDAELIEEQKLARKQEEEANIALIESWENTQAMMEADRLLAERL